MKSTKLSVRLRILYSNNPIDENTKYEVFYDLYNRNLLGYREINKDFNVINKPNCKIKINYSIKNILSLFEQECA